MPIKMDPNIDLLPPVQPLLMPSLSSIMADNPDSQLKREEIIDWTRETPPGALLDLVSHRNPSLYRLPSQQPTLTMTISTAAAPHTHDDIIRHDDSLPLIDHLMPPHMLRHDSLQHPMMTRWDSRYYQHTLLPPLFSSQSSIDKSISSSSTSCTSTSSYTRTFTSPSQRTSFEQAIASKLSFESSSITSKVHAAASIANDVTLQATSMKHESDESDDDMQHQTTIQPTKKRKRALSEDSDPDYDEAGDHEYVDDNEIEVASHSSSHSSHSPIHNGAPQHIRIRTSEDSAHHKRRQSSTKYKRTHKKVQRGQQLVLKSTDNRANYKVAVCKQYYNNKWCVRLVTATDTATQETYRFVHGPDVAGLVKRKSNISRLLGQYSSPTEKMIMNVPSARCPNTGQPSNVLTLIGLNRLVREEIVHHDRAYATWLVKTCVPYLEGTVHHTMDA